MAALFHDDRVLSKTHTGLHRYAVRLESWSGAYLGVGMPGLSQAVVQLFLWIFFSLVHSGVSFKSVHLMHSVVWVMYFSPLFVPFPMGKGSHEYSYIQVFGADFPQKVSLYVSI